MIGISLTNDCDECAKMERELKRAASLVRHTKEKLFFGIIEIHSPKDLTMNLKIDKFPSLVAIKEGLDPMIYGSTLDYLQFIKYLRGVYEKNKIKEVSTEA